MAPEHPDVKSRARQIADWIDSHPRTGWYVAIWAALVTINTFIGLFDWLLGLVG